MESKNGKNMYRSEGCWKEKSNAITEKIKTGKF